MSGGEGADFIAGQFDWSGHVGSRGADFLVEDLLVQVHDAAPPRVCSVWQLRVGSRPEAC